jgi:Caspase domain
MAKRAVLIGINQYQSASVPNLHGCLNDVELVRDVLTERFGFDDGDITTVVDPENTRQHILDALDRLVETTEQDDVAMVYYSGHGSQAPDAPGGEEEDRMDETIVPADSGRGDLPVRDLVDDEINSFIAALAERTDHAALIFDSCHSGSVDRGLLEQPTRDEVPASRAIPPAKTPPEGERHIRPEAQDVGSAEKSESGFLRRGNHVLVAGCRDEQTSKETDFEGTRNGALTYFLMGALRAGDELTLRAAFDQAVAGVTGAVEEQDPVLEGPDQRLDQKPFQGAGSAAA